MALTALPRNVRHDKGGLHPRPRRGAGRGEPRQRGPRRADVVHQPHPQSAHVGSDDEVLHAQFPPFRSAQPRAGGDIARPPREAADRDPPCTAQPQSDRLGLIVAPRALEMKRDGNQDVKEGTRMKSRKPAAEDRPQGAGSSVLQTVDDLPDRSPIDRPRKDRGAPGMVDAGGGPPTRQAAGNLTGQKGAQTLPTQHLPQPSADGTHHGPERVEQESKAVPGKADRRRGSVRHGIRSRNTVME